MTEANQLVRFGSKWRDVPVPQPLTDGTDDTLENDIILSSEPQSLVLEISSEQYTKLLSAALNGANTFFPDEYISVIYPLIKAGKLMLCTEVADCLENSDALKNAMLQFLALNGYGSGGQTTVEPPPLPTSITDENLLPAGYSCDDDALCGMARWIVTNLDDGVIQLLEQLEVATNTWELLATFVDNVEVVSWLGSVAEFALWVQDQLIEYYSAAYSATVEDELTCDIYCKIQPDCHVSIDRLIEAYEQAIVSSFSLPALVDEVSVIFNWLEGLDYEFANAKAVIASFHWAILQFLRFGSKALNYTGGIRSFKQMIATGEDETDSYCAANCDCDELNGYSQNFGVGLGEWTLVHGTLGGGGIQSEDIGGVAQITLTIEFDEAFRVAGFSSIIDRESGGSVNDDMRIWQNNNSPPDATGLVLDYNFPVQAYGEVITCNTGLGSAERTGLRVIFRDNLAEDTMLLKQIKIWNSSDTLPTNITANSIDECYE